MTNQVTSAKYGNQAPVENFWVDGFRWIRHIMSVTKSDMSFAQKLIEMNNFMGWLPPLSADGFLICKNCSNFKKGIIRRKNSRNYRSQRCICKEGRGRYVHIMAIANKRHQAASTRINQKFNITDRSKRMALITSEMLWEEHSILQWLQRDIVVVMEDAGHLFWRMDDMETMPLGDEQGQGEGANIKAVEQIKIIRNGNGKGEKADLTKIPEPS